jgi:hypothetical protein
VGHFVTANDRCCRAANGYRETFQPTLKKQQSQVIGCSAHYVLLGRVGRVTAISHVHVLRLNLHGWLIIARRPPRHAEILDMISMVSMSSSTSVPRGNSSVLYSIDLSSVAKAKSNTAMQLSTMKSAKEAWLMQGATSPATAKDPSRRPHQHRRQTE